jgi:NhaP-type Na+/H+ or K+/H+ antiporter
MNSEYKNLIITTTISLIIFTIIGLGSTTTLVIKLLMKIYPGDKLLELGEDEEPLNPKD